MDKKLSAATKDWWDLHISDRKLLVTIILANCYDQITSADIPIFLPHSSTKVKQFTCCYVNCKAYINRNPLFLRKP